MSLAYRCIIIRMLVPPSSLYRMNTLHVLTFSLTYSVAIGVKVGSFFTISKVKHSYKFMLRCIYYFFFSASSFLFNFICFYYNFTLNLNFDFILIVFQISATVLVFLFIYILYNSYNTHIFYGVIICYTFEVFFRIQTVEIFPPK